MSKLVVKIRDDDKYFLHCPLHHEGYCHLPQTHYWQGNALYMQQCLGILNKRPPWCPLEEESSTAIPIEWLEKCKDKYILCCTIIDDIIEEWKEQNEI